VQLLVVLFALAQTLGWWPWDELAQCESRGIWDIHTGGAGIYTGGLQMDHTFWVVHGGLEYASAPWLASREEQIQVAINGRDGLVGYAQGYYAWPVCGRIVGLI